LGLYFVKNPFFDDYSMSSKTIFSFFLARLRSKPGFTTGSEPKYGVGYNLSQKHSVYLLHPQSTKTCVGDKKKFEKIQR
jgi:hypothetical protein